VWKDFSLSLEMTELQHDRAVMSLPAFCFLRSKPPAICGLFQAEKVEEPSWLFVSPFKRLEASSTLAFQKSNIIFSIHP